MKEITITPVSENRAPSGMGLMAEHGLSFHIKNGEEELLFDTGQGLVLQNNMKILGMEPSSISKVVISHGHYDHTGGLDFLASKSKFQLFGHNKIFDEKLASIDGEHFINIGCQIAKEELMGKGISMELFSTEPEKISDNIFSTGEIPLKTPYEEIEPYFYTRVEDKTEKDTLSDDLGIIMETKKGLVVILGCTHRGIINSLSHISDMTGKKKFHMVIGGLHLGMADKEKMDMIIEALGQFEIENLITGHCTGDYASTRLASSDISHSFIKLGNRYSF